MAENYVLGGKEMFLKLYDIDTRGRAVTKDDGKKSLDYLPWAVTYSEVAKNANIDYGFDTFPVKEKKKTIKILDDGTQVVTKSTTRQRVPYVSTDAGLMVSTWVEIDGVRKEMMLPVYDSSYRAMKLVPYTYTTKSGERTVPAATMGDIYKGILRCFAKCLSMWGVGLNYWTREDAPESVLAVEKLWGEIDQAYVSKKKKGFTDEELLSVISPLLPEDLNGNYHLCDNEEILTDIKKKLLALRKI